MHALLTPGTHVLRRSRSRVQVGLGPGRVVRLDVPSAGSGDWDPSERRAWEAVPAPVLARLVADRLAAGDDRALREALPAQRGDQREDQREDQRDLAAWQRHTLSALFREDPARMASAVEQRRRAEVTVTPFGHPVAARMAADLAELCRRTGLPLSADHSPGPAKKGAPAPRPVVVVVGAGEPRRELLDPLVRDGVPHLLVRMVEGEAVLGPFVDPGSTACLRCLDAHRTRADPAWPLLVEQYARATAQDRPDGVPEPVDAALAALALAWAARDLATLAGGGRPVTHSTTVRISPALEALETRTWPPHSSCGCGWS